MAQPTAPDRAQLETICQRIRTHIVSMTHAAQSGHPGGSLSAVEIFAALYFGGVARHDPQRPDWPQRDRIILSKGHATPVLYAALAEAGYFDHKLLPTFRSLGSPLQGHVVRGRPAGVEMSGGALGMGLSFSVGLALGNRLSEIDANIFCVLGDGELNEGQNDGPGDEIMRLDPVADKWAAFGWGVHHVDGHDVSAVRDALALARDAEGAPQVVIAETVKGKGVSFMASNPAAWHGKGPSDEQLEQALAEIAAGLDHNSSNGSVS